MNFDELQAKVIKWSNDRRIIQHGKSETQLFKAFSEMGELADATIKNIREDKIDAVGDVLVCLINYCAIEGVSMNECLLSAYEEIKDRKGTTLENGTFVKE